MSPGGLLGRGGAQAGPWWVSRIFTGAEGNPFQVKGVLEVSKLTEAGTLGQ